jgi:hypothetical protein
LGPRPDADNDPTAFCFWAAALICPLPPLGNEIRNMSERMDTADKRLDGATLVVKAWLDPSFEERLLSDAGDAAAEIGISAVRSMRSNRSFRICGTFTSLYCFFFLFMY